MRHSFLSKSRFEQIEHATDLPIAVLALLIVPALILEEYARNAGVRTFAQVINWIVWLAFCAEYLGKLAYAPSRRSFVRHAWFDLLIIVLSPPFLVPRALQNARAVRAVRVLRLLRVVRAAAVAVIGLKEAGEAFRQRRFHYVILTTAVVVSIGAVGIFAVESGQNKAIASLGDAFWWAIVTTTTVGYGDVSPVTTEGRLIAVALMVIGIGFIGVLTATLTSFFVDTGGEAKKLDDRLLKIEEKLDALIARQKPL
jgi:voltage-gated potassium channel